MEVVLLVPCAGLPTILGVAGEGSRGYTAVGTGIGPAAEVDSD